MDREWYNVAGAAERIGCSESDVLHLAAIGKLQLCYMVPGVPAYEHFYDRTDHLLLHTDNATNLHGLAGLTAFCAGELAMKGCATAQYFLNLSKPGHEFRLAQAAAYANRPEISIRGNEVDVTIYLDEVVVRSVDLEAYRIAAGPAPTDRRRDRVDEAPSSGVDVIAEWFDPVPVAMLEAMFPANGKWKSWAEHAKESGLIVARVRRAKFNPFHAAMWFLQCAAAGWTQERVYRTLAKNLPARSADKRDQLLTGLE
jgi:hypothetical protein